MLTIAERTGDALIHSKEKEMIDEMDEEFAKVIEDFMRVAVEVLCLAKRSGNHLLSQSSVIPFSAASCRTGRARPLLMRLKPLEAGYQQDLRCMEGTRKSLKIGWPINRRRNIFSRSSTHFLTRLGLTPTSSAIGSLRSARCRAVVRSTPIIRRNSALLCTVRGLRMLE